MRVDNNAKIGEKKNVNLPGCKVNLPTVTEKDEMDILEFGLKKGIDIIALSFCRTAKDVEDLRDLMGPRGSLIKIIPKIENLEGLENYDEILKVSGRKRKEERREEGGGKIEEGFGKGKS